MRYRVSWTVNVEAESPSDAAFKARDKMSNPELLETASLSVFNERGDLEVFEFEKTITTTQKCGRA